MKTIFLIGLLIISSAAFSQTQFENTLSFTDTGTSPQADLSSVSWLAGHWRGEAFNGIVEELWSPPLGGSMMGSFKLVADGMLQFYELETIAEENGTLILRLKHFNSNLTGWEEKDKTVDFRLVKVEEGKVFFDGFTIERVGDSEMNMYVRIQNGEEIEEVKFNYRKLELK